MNAYKLTVSTPAGKVFDDNVTYLGIRGTEGEMGIMAGHSPIVTTVVKSTCKIKITDDSIFYADVSEGLLTVAKDGATLLVHQFIKK